MAPKAPALAFINKPFFKSSVRAGEAETFLWGFDFKKIDSVTGSQPIVQ
jgi:hypothetical protein